MGGMERGESSGCRGNPNNGEGQDAAERGQATRSWEPPAGLAASPLQNGGGFWAPLASGMGGMEDSRPVSSDGFHSSGRLKELAKPKEVKDVWNYSRKLVWGNQETIWPLSSRALLKQPSPRLMALAKPKSKPERALQPRPIFMYSCGRESEIWERPGVVYSATPSKRLLQLAEPKQQYLAAYLKRRPRSSPMWPVSYSALCCDPTPRLVALAEPRPFHPCFTLPKEAETQVSGAAKRASASLRIERLAQPVVRNHIVFYDNRCAEAPIRQVSQAAQQAVASPRIVELAKPKALPYDSAPDRSAMWSVSTAAKHAVASPRIEELSQPPKRAPTNFVQFDPEAFNVKETAKNAVCSQRIKELATPIMR